MGKFIIDCPTKGHKTLTKDLIKQLPPLYSQDGKDQADVRIIIKFFDPCSGWTWYVTEGEDLGNDWEFFGLVRGIETEFGYFRLSELESYKNKLGLGIERDLHFGVDHTLAEAFKGRI